MQPPPPHFERVAIVGAGLLGASLGLALKARELAGEIVGVGRREESLRKALHKGAIDRFTLNLSEATANADLVVIATPADSVIPALDAVRQSCHAQTVVTDVASTKAKICGHAQDTWPAPRRFIGSHPMAGSEQFGPEHARAELYAGSVCLIEPGIGVDPHAHATVRRLWEAVGAEVVEIGAQQHDALLARTSHLPHILASAIALVADRSGNVQKLVGNGFRDTTRIAEGRPEVWRDICLTNREAICESLRELRTVLLGVANAMTDEDGAKLEHFFETARDARQRIVPK